MSTTSGNNYINARVLRINVGFIFSESIGYIHETEFSIPSPVRVSNDLTLNHFYATLRLLHTREGILVQGNVQTSIPADCSRCSDDILLSIEYPLEELFSTEQNASTEFVIGEDNMMNLAPLIREETLLHIPMVTPYDENGRCVLCERTFEEVLDENGLSRGIDPRLEILMTLRDQLADDEQ